MESSADECKICYNTKSNTVLIPCGHKCICMACSVGIKGLCPICRKNVVQVV